MLSFLAEEVAQRALTLHTHPYELSPFLAERQVSLIGSKSAIRIKLHYGLDFSRAETTSATLRYLLKYQRPRQFSSPLVARRAISHSIENHISPQGPVWG
jgi:hypothetical protein